MQNQLLIIVGRAPVAGHTKTRLGRRIGNAAAAELYRCFLLDTVHACRQVADVALALAYVPAEGAAALLHELVPDVQLIPQAGANLAERLNNLISTHLHAGYEAVGVLSSDIPLVDPTALAQGFAALTDGYEVALGPCDDGGYYLLASRVRCPTLFENIQMSTATVAAETIAAAENAGLRVALLPPTFDVDTTDDLERLTAALPHIPASRAPHTRAWLRAKEG
jgi:hypothetical protein